MKPALNGYRNVKTAELYNLARCAAGGIEFANAADRIGTGSPTSWARVAMKLVAERNLVLAEIERREPGAGARSDAIEAITRGERGPQPKNVTPT
jgi:hypothetical protein